MHSHARKILTYYTVEGHQTMTVYNLTEDLAPTVVVTADGRSWRLRGLMVDLPEDFELTSGDYFLSVMTTEDAQQLSQEVVDRSWETDAEMRRLYGSPEEMRAVVMAGLASEINNHRALILCQYA